MILRYFIIIFTLLATLPAAAQMSRGGDDTLSFMLRDAVTVTATRIPTALRDAPAAADIHTARSITVLPVRSLSDLLSLSSGATVRDYGGTGSLQLASLRGLGAEYTLVLLNGMRLNSAQNSLVDVGQLTLQQVDRVEIVRGGLASLYGSNALGGVVNIVTSRDRAPLSAAVGYGAFGWKEAALAAGASGSAGRLFADLRYEEGANDFAFTPSWGGKELRRSNAAMLRRSLTAGGTLLFKDAVLTMHADLLHLDLGTPGPVFSAAQGRARQEDRHALLSLQLDAQLGGRRQLRASAGVRGGIQEYRDPDYRINGEPLESRYDQAQFFAATMLEQEFTGGHRLLAGVDLAWDRLESADIAAQPERFQGAIVASADIHARLAGLPLRLYPALRYDAISDVFSGADAAGSGLVSPGVLHALSPSFGLHVEMLPGTLAARGRFARAFGMPTFNQLYWREGGNPDLRPEYSTAVDAGLVHTVGKGFSTMELTWFHHDVTDKIVWAPSSGIFWTPRNVQHVISTGVEAQLQLAWEKLSVRAAAQWMSSRKANAAFPGDATQDKQLIYVPEWSGALTLIAAPLDWLTVTLTERVLGRRYYNETNTASLPTHALTDLAAQAAVELAGLGTTWKLEMLNVFDASYEVVAFYPMPGRHLRLTLRTTVR